MPKKNGLDLLTELQRTDELPPTILLTTFDDDDALLDGIKAGARGYLLKDVSLEQLTDAIRTVSRGETLIRPAITERVLRGLEHVRQKFDALDPPDPLTPRELEVLRLMAGGYSNREILGRPGHCRGHGQEPRVQRVVEARRPRPDPRRVEGTGAWLPRRLNGRVERGRRVESLIADVRHAIRSVRAAPGSPCLPSCA